MLTIPSTLTEKKLRCCSFASSLFAKNQPSRCPQLHYLFSSGLNGSSCYHGIHTSSEAPPGMLIWTKKMVDALENYKEIHGDLLVKKRYAYHFGNILHNCAIS
jgi:hypothetical protein